MCQPFILCSTGITVTKFDSFYFHFYAKEGAVALLHFKGRHLSFHARINKTGLIFLIYVSTYTRVLFSTCSDLSAFIELRTLLVYIYDISS